MHEACSYSGEQVLGRRCSNEEPPPAPCRAGSLTQGQLECSRGSKEPLPCRLQPTVSRETADRPVGIPEGSGPVDPDKLATSDSVCKHCCFSLHTPHSQAHRPWFLRPPPPSSVPLASHGLPASLDMHMWSFKA